MTIYILVVIEKMKITERIEAIDGVENCYYNFDAMSLAVYYTKGSDLFFIKIKIVDIIDKAGLHRAVETINFYSMENN